MFPASSWYMHNHIDPLAIINVLDVTKYVALYKYLVP